MEGPLTGWDTDLGFNYLSGLVELGSWTFPTRPFFGSVHHLVGRPSCFSRRSGTVSSSPRVPLLVEQGHKVPVS